jgi:ketosteroid isomerase-like protein
MEPAPELRDVVMRFYQAMGEGNADAFEAMASRRGPAVFIGTDPQEWWENVEDVSKAVRELVSAGITLVPGDIKAYREGSVGWIADQGRFRMEDGTEVPFRLTAVFREEDGDWKMVQEHASVGVPNVEVVGQDLDT